MMNIAREVTLMGGMTVDQLRAKYAEVFREQCRSRHKQWIIKRIVWRMQANEEGDLSERARRRAMELANDADLRMTPPREPKVSAGAAERTKSVMSDFPSSSRPLPGTVLTRVYKGQTVRVNVLAEGFECHGQRYKSLTAVAKAVTGKHWNGHHFFGLRESGGDR